MSVWHKIRRCCDVFARFKNYLAKTSQHDTPTAFYSFPGFTPQVFA